MDSPRRAIVGGVQVTAEQRAARAARFANNRPEDFPAPKKVMAHSGGVITTNKEEAVAKFYERQGNQATHGAGCSPQGGPIAARNAGTRENKKAPAKGGRSSKALAIATEKRQKAEKLREKKAKRALAAHAEATRQDAAQCVAQTGAPPPADNAGDLAQSIIRGNAVVVFSSPTCRFCADAVAALKAAGVGCRLVQATPSTRHWLANTTGQASVPSCWVAGRFVGGCNDGPKAWMGIAPMLKSGKLRRMLEKRAAQLSENGATPTSAPAAKPSAGATAPDSVARDGAGAARAAGVTAGCDEVARNTQKPAAAKIKKKKTAAAAAAAEAEAETRAVWQAQSEGLLRKTAEKAAQKARATEAAAEAEAMAAALSAEQAAGADQVLQPEPQPVPKAAKAKKQKQKAGGQAKKGKAGKGKDPAKAAEKAGKPPAAIGSGTGAGKRRMLDWSMDISPPVYGSLLPTGAGDAGKPKPCKSKGEDGRKALNLKRSAAEIEVEVVGAATVTNPGPLTPEKKKPKKKKKAVKAVEV